MKHIRYIFLALLLTCGMSASAQGRFDASIFGGANFSQVDGDDAGSYSLLGLRGGVGTSFFFGWDDRTPWRMVVELAFTSKGSNINNDVLHRRIELNYVEVPIMMSYTLLEKRLRLAAGVAPAVLTGARVNDNGGERNTAVENLFRRFDWCPLTLSARYLFSYNLAVELRFQTSLISVSEPTAGTAYRIFRDNKGCFNRSLGIGVAYCF